MCNACGFLCCGSDQLATCGCDSCGTVDCMELCDTCHGAIALGECVCDEEYPDGY